jgi:diacylglycerol O-acyltransferase / wax synthase
VRCLDALLHPARLDVFRGWQSPRLMAERLSALDASFLAVERRTMPMHVGWVARFDPPADGPRPTARELLDHIAARMEHAHRYRQRLATVPLGVHEPVWVDDTWFDPARHLHDAGGEDPDALADEVLSPPLERDRPLWEMWATDDLVLVGKAHHCMVDGAAVVELGNLLLDAQPDAPEPDAPDWSPAPEPTPGRRLGRAIADRTGEAASLLVAPLRLRPKTVTSGARLLAHTLLPLAPDSPLNRRGLGRRHHIRVTRSLDELRGIRRRFRVTPNDVVLAACAGALRAFAAGRGETPRSLKVMVPADVRSSEDPAASGNRISFVFIELPCDEPDPVARLRAVHRATAQRRRDGEAESLDTAFRVLALTPPPVQRALAHAFAHPRLFNLTISSVPGPAAARYLRGCRLREVHPAIPLGARHALSIGVVTIAGNACFGISSDPAALPDADVLADDLEASLDELLVLADAWSATPGSTPRTRGQAR